MKTKRSTALLLTFSFLSIAGLSSAENAAPTERTSFDIPPQNLEAALIRFSEQTDIQLVMASADVDGKEVDGVSGEYTSEAALDTLLASTGLEYAFINDRTVSVSSVVENQGGDSDSKNLSAGPTPVLMAQNQTSQAQTTSSRTSEGGTSIVTGNVTDARTGANLKGAKVTIEETGQWTSTNDLGEFRFVNVPTGSATLTVSYLGYAGQSAVVGVRREGASHNFALRGGDEHEEIVVFGQRSARALSLNQERTAENSSTVLSADLLGQFDGTTVSDSLRRAPGVAFQQDPTTGDGTNVIVRGLEPDFNTVTLNGVRLPDSSGIGRSPNLNNLLTDSISSITISKTLLPSQDSSGTGGLIDIETKGPLDRPRRYISLGVEGAKSQGDFLRDFLITGTVSGILGTDQNIGLSASVQYRERDNQTLNYSTGFNFGRYLPLLDDGTPAPNLNAIDPFAQFPFESGIDEAYPLRVTTQYVDTETSNLSISLSAQWKIREHTELSFDYTRAEASNFSFGRSTSTLPLTRYELLPIDSLGGELRNALVWEDAFAALGFPGGLTQIDQIYATDDETSTTNLFSLRGQTRTGPWRLNYKFGYTSGAETSPDEAFFRVSPTFGSLVVPIDESFLLQEATSNRVDGRLVHPYAPRIGRAIPLPLLNQAGFDFFNNPENFFLLDGFVTSGESENSRISGDLSLRYDFSGKNLRYLEIGAFYERAKFTNISLGGFSVNSAGLTLTQLGLPFGEDNLAAIGQEGGFAVVAERDIRDFLASIESIADTTAGLSLVPSQPNPLITEAFTRENEFSAYIQGRVDFGRLELIGGARLSNVDIVSRNPQFPTLRDESGNIDREFQDRFTIAVDQSGKQTDILPRMLANFRVNDNFVIRAGYFLSIARPQIQNLSGRRGVELDLQPIFGPNADQPQLTVTEANPDLDPSYTDNFDISFELYDDNVGVIKSALFYKSTKNLLQSNQRQGFDVLDGVILPDDRRFQNLPDNILVRGFRPANSEFSADIWGVETSIEKQLAFLPGRWSGLGVYLNYTYTDSSKPLVIDRFLNGVTSQIVVDDVRFNQDPKHSGTAALTYNKYGIDASLVYTRQARRLNLFSLRGLSQYDEADSTLDFRAEYRFERVGGNWRVYFEGSDLLKGADDPDVEQSRGGIGQTPKLYTGGTFFGGRAFRAGLAVTF